MPAGGAAEPAAAASDSKEEHSPLLQTPRSVSDFAASLRSEGARATSPFGRDFEQLEFGSKLGAPECLRRLLSLRFGDGYVTLPMTNAQAYTIYYILYTIYYIPVSYTHLTLPTNREV